MKRLLVALLVVALLVSLSAVAVSAQPDKAGRPEKLDQVIFVHPVEPQKGKPPPKEEEPKDNTYYELWGGYLAGTAEYKVNPKVTLVTGTNPAGAIEAAAEAWDVVTTAELFSYAGETTKNWYAEDGQNTVSWVKFVPRNYIAIAVMWYDPVTMIIWEFDIVFNTFHAWGIDPDGEGTLYKLSKAFDIQNIATHEFGHPVGLNDLYLEKYSELTMYGYSSTGETKKCSLETGDIAGAQNLYGTP